MQNNPLPSNNPAGIPPKLPEMIRAFSFLPPYDFAAVKEAITTLYCSGMDFCLIGFHTDPIKQSIRSSTVNMFTHDRNPVINQRKGHAFLATAYELTLQLCKDFRYDPRLLSQLRPPQSKRF